jgi:chromate transporter
MIYIELFYVFFLMGLFTIGGGYAMIPLIEDQVVGRGWLSAENLINFFAISESTPGPFAVNTATLVGFSKGGIPGAIVATFGVILPSFIIILIIAKFLNDFLKYRTVKDALNGVKPIVTGLVLSVAIGLIVTNFVGHDILKPVYDFVALGILVFLFILKRVYKKLNVILLIVIAAVLGIVFYGII